MNVVVLCGNLGRDPEVRSTQSGKSVCNFSIATRRGQDKEPDWHSIVAWERTADLCGKYLQKGSKVVVRGELTYRTWEDKEGVKRTSAEVVAHAVEFASPPKGVAEPVAPAPSTQQSLDAMPF